MSASSRRPSVLRWIAYAYGAGLPGVNSGWVLHDVTCPTFALRHLARMLVQIGPFVIVILVAVPGQLWIRLAAVIGATIMAAIFSFAYLVETAEHRVVKAGYPVGTAERLRSERSRRDRSAGVASTPGQDGGPVRAPGEPLNSVCTPAVPR